jgi:hypothetical protein
MSATGWTLDPACRELLLDLFPPRWHDMVADHITLAGDAPDDAPLPRQTSASVIGHADDGKGLEALVVAIDGSPRRPDGSIFHITWSLERDGGRKAVESNALLAKQGWRELAAPIEIAIMPARL